MPVFNNILAGAAGQSGSGYEIQRSLRFSDDDSASLTKTFSSAGDRKRFTISLWVKRGKLGKSYQPFICNTNSSGTEGLYFDFSSDYLHFGEYATNGWRWQLQSEAQYRDVSAWYHILASVDTSQTSQGDRVKLYVNGEQITTFYSGLDTYPSQNLDIQFNNTSLHAIGRLGSNTSTSYHFDGLMAEFHFVDGAALAATDFGEFSTTGVWNPIKYAGSHNVGSGVNGFYLDFADNSSNAALGYDAAGSFNWTVNNLEHRIDTTIWSSYLYTSNYTYDGTSTTVNFQEPSNGVAQAFNGSTSNECVSNVGGSSYIYFRPPGGFSNPSKIRIYTSNVGEFRINGTVVTTSPSAGSSAQWYEVTSTLPSTVTEIAHNGESGTYNARVRAYEIDDQVLILAGVNTDLLLDSPTNYEASSGNNGGNYATWNPLTQRSVVTTSNGNLTANTVTNGNGWVVSSIPVSSGKYYCEISFGDIEASHNTNFKYIGIVPASSQANYTGLDVFRALGALSIDSNGTSEIRGHIGDGSGTTTTTYTSSYGFDENDVIGIAIDCDTPQVTFYKNGVSIGTFPYAMQANESWVVFMNDWASGYTDIEEYFFNAGQRPFLHAPPAGFNSICTQNLPDPLIDDGSNHFDVKTWSGTGSENTLSGFEFSPDMIWVKRRNNNTDWHNITDTVRGVTNTIYPNDAYVETATSQNVKAFTSDGVTLGTFSGVNASGGTYVGWAWDGGNLATSTNNLQTETWSAATGALAAESFDGNTNTQGYMANEQWYKIAGSLTVSSSMRIYLRKDEQYKMRINGGTEFNANTRDTSVSNNYDWAAISISTGTHTNVEIKITGGGGYINAIEVDGKIMCDPGHIPVGSLNSSVYDQSDVWSDNAYADPSSATAGLTNLTNAFDGTLANNNLSSFTGEVIFPEIQFSSGVTEVIVYAYYSGSTDWWVKLNQNGTQYNLYQQTIVHALGQVPGGGAYIAAVKLNLNETSITRFSYHGAGNHWFAGVSVNGKLLVNSNATPADVPSSPSTCRTNQTAGFSIVKYAPNGNAQTIAHNLNQKPEMMIVKNLDHAYNWYVYHKDLDSSAPEDKFVVLNGTHSIQDSANAWSDMPPTSNVFTVDGGNTAYQYAEHIAYCFTSIPEYSAVGSYTGRGSTYPYIYLGFKPAWVMIKNVTTSGTHYDWVIIDSARNPFNKGADNVDSKSFLFANLADQEDKGYTDWLQLDFLSNGFRVNEQSSTLNQSGSKFVYLAFAQRPFKYERAL